MTLPGITGFGSYIPRLRIERRHIADAHAWMAPGLRGAAKGSRAYCSWDEDPITMAVEAARDCLGTRDRSNIGALSLASTTLPFADLQNSAIVAGALQLNNSIESYDIAHSQRAGTAGLVQALRNHQDGLFIASERPVAKPASVQELSFGAGAVAFTTGTKDVIAELVASSSVTANFVDHFRAAGEKYDYSWEERWVRDEGVLKLIPQAVNATLAKASICIGDIHHLVVPPVQRGTAAVVAKQLGFTGNLTDELNDGCGYTGSAHALLMLANTLEEAKPGELILVVSFGQGADALLLRTTDKLASFSPVRGVRGALDDALPTDKYLQMLSFYDGIDLEWGMRSEKSGKTVLSSQYRHLDQTAGFNAGRCTACGTVQFPQLQYCANGECHAPASQFEDESLAEVPSSVLTYTSDWLSYYPAPPLNVGFIQFENGARLLMEMVDVGGKGLEVGMPMRKVFRVKEIDRQRGYKRYFWKATPISGNEV